MQNDSLTGREQAIQDIIADDYLILDVILERKARAMLGCSHCPLKPGASVPRVAVLIMWSDYARWN